MNAVLKNNKMLLGKREKFKRTFGNYQFNSKGLDLPTATPQLLRGIKRRLQEERRIRKRNILTVWSILMITLLCAFVYIMY